MKKPLLLLFSRLLLFLVFQLIIALFLQSFARSQHYWLLAATLTNIVSIGLLIWLFRKEGGRYFSIFRFNKETWKKDLLYFLLLSSLSFPLVFGPNIVLSNWLLGGITNSYSMLFQPLPVPLVWVLLLLFPLTIAFAELATYFAYVMPRLKTGIKQQWLVVALPVLFLSLQHITMPFIPDYKFILYRALMYFPFALLIGISIYKRPTLFPWFAVVHGLMDAGTVIMLLTESYKTA